MLTKFQRVGAVGVIALALIFIGTALVGENWREAAWAFNTAAWAAMWLGLSLRYEGDA